ncbi:hypothetical protein ACFO4E_18445 [Nocardiopsis mangrovi]|uniref:Ribosomal protein L7/L12 C-terminal domain-containing protein n=1 Tax=Nocardiopsis mangrovi TaxID=1179818 RepID=A0ABV9E1F6_9ACTN
MGFLLMVLVVLAAVVVLRVGAVVTDRLGAGDEPPPAAPGPVPAAEPVPAPGGYTLLDPGDPEPGTGRPLPDDTLELVRGLLAQGRGADAVAAVRAATGLPEDRAAALVARIGDGRAG